MSISKISQILAKCGYLLTECGSQWMVSKIHKKNDIKFFPDLDSVQKNLHFFIGDPDGR